MIDYKTCVWLGIYPDNIERGGDTFDSVCEAFGLDADALWDIARKEFEAVYGSNFGNEVNRLLFYVLASALERERKAYGSDIDWEINGMCVDFYVDGEQY